MAVKDSKLEQKEQLVVKGTMFADEFRERETGKLLGSGEPIDLTDYVKIHNFEEGTILTDEILAEVKSGDILKVNQMEFIVNNKPNESPRVITGSSVGSTGTILVLNWVKGQTLSPELKPISSLTLLGSTTLSFTSGDPGNIQAIFNLSASSLEKITAKTILVFTYGNCFVLGMLGQTGEGRVCGNLVYDNNGNSSLCKIKINLVGTTISVVTNLAQAFPESSIPTAYLYAFSVI